jgi:hypothetical protein
MQILLFSGVDQKAVSNKKNTRSKLKMWSTFQYLVGHLPGTADHRVKIPSDNWPSQRVPKTADLYELLMYKGT